MASVRELVEDARELDPSFTTDRHPFRVVVGFLSRLHRRLVGEWVKHEPRAHVEVLIVNFPLDDFASGFDLVSNFGESLEAPLDVTRFDEPLAIYYSGEELPDDLGIISYADRHRFQRHRRAFYRNETLYFTGTEDMWTGVEKVELTYTPTPGNITDLDADLVLPTTSDDVVVAWIAAHMAGRSKDEELAKSKRTFRSDALDAEALWIDELKHRKGVTVSRRRARY